MSDGPMIQIPCHKILILLALKITQVSLRESWSTNFNNKSIYNFGGFIQVSIFDETAEDMYRERLCAIISIILINIIL